MTMRKEKGKMKMSKYGTDKDEANQSESDSEKNKYGPSETKFESTKTALKLVD